MVTVADLFEKSSRIIGARTGTVASGSTTTNVILNGLISTTGDDTYYAGDRLILLDAPPADQERLIKSWTDATGTATVSTLSGAPQAGDRYIVMAREDYTLNELRLAAEKALYYSGRSYRQVIPLTPNLRLYPLSMCDWLHGAGDIDSAWLSGSPIFLHNEDMSLWEDGPNAAPDGYTFIDEGTGGTIEKLTGGMRSAFKARITAGSGIVRLEQPIPDSVVAWVSTRTQPAPVRYPVRPWGWASTPDANAVRFYVFDGTTRTYTDYLTATVNGVPEFAETAINPDASQTAYTWGIEISAGHSADLHVAGEVALNQTVASTYSLKQQGSQGFNEVQIPLNERNLGGVPTIEIPTWPGAWYQLIVYVRRPFAAYVSDDDTVDDQYVPALTAGLVRYLLEPVKPDQDRSRLDPIMKQQARDWSRFTTSIRDIPVPTPLNQWNVGGII